MSETATDFDFGFDDWRLDTGGEFNREIQSYYASFTVPLWNGDGKLLFLESQFTWNEPLEEQVNVGLVYRQWCESLGAIIGANVFYDYGNSRNGNSFNGLGLGFEVLNEGYEIHLNYVLPEKKQPVFDRRSFSSTKPVGTDRSRRGNTSTSVTEVSNGQSTVRTTTTRRNTALVTDRNFERVTYFSRGREAAMEGGDVEFGVPISCLPDSLNIWIFSGVYDYNNPFGGDLNGFQGRVEWRVNPNLALEAAYFTDDRFIVGDNWFVGLRGSIPLDDGSGEGLLAALFHPQPGPGIESRWLQRVRRDRRHHMTETKEIESLSRFFTRRTTKRSSSESVTVFEEEIDET